MCVRAGTDAVNRRKSDIATVPKSVRGETRNGATAGSAHSRSIGSAASTGPGSYTVVGASLGVVRNIAFKTAFTWWWSARNITAILVSEEDAKVEVGATISTLRLVKSLVKDSHQNDMRSRMNLMLSSSGETYNIARSSVAVDQALLSRGLTLAVNKGKSIGIDKRMISRWLRYSVSQHEQA